MVQESLDTAHNRLATRAHVFEELAEPLTVSQHSMRKGSVMGVLYGCLLVRYNDFSRAKPDANNVLLSVFQEGVLDAFPQPLVPPIL